MWSYHNPVAIHFGAGALAALERLSAGRPYALVTYAEPPFRALRKRIEDAVGKPAVVIDNILPNPDFQALRAACAEWGAAPRKPEIIIAVGGGSVIDSAKVLAAADGDFARVQRHLESGQDGAELARVPMIAVPTTAGTGSDVTMWATVWDSQRGKKYSLTQPTLYPEHSVVDPELMLGMPRALTVATGLDALSHALESIWNRNANPVSTHYAVAAASELLAALPLSVENPQDLTLRARVARAALLAGLAFSNTRTALAHSISYPITLKHGVPHGIACSFMLPQVLRSAIGVRADCDAALSAIFGPDLTVGAQRLTGFLERLGVSDDPGDHGIGGEEWREIVTGAIGGERGRNHIAPEARVFESLEVSPVASA